MSMLQDYLSIAVCLVMSCATMIADKPVVIKF